MSIYRFDPIDFSRIVTSSLAARPSKVTVRDFAKPLSDQDARNVGPLIDSLPSILGAESLKGIVSAILEAKARKRAIIWGFGGHVIKTGLAPILIDLMRRGFVTALATNGAGVIHDFEIALAGSTSEDVDSALGSGAFGMAEETGRLLNEAIRSGANDACGVGESVGRTLSELAPPFGHLSMLQQAFEARVPVTAHITIGTDTIHLHPQADGAAIGTATYRDFKLFISIVRELDRGGVYINVGSAVTLPEVFLKAVTVVRNLGYPLSDFTTANFDFVQHYRPQTNVVRRPVANGGGKGYSIIGHHELMIPLLAAAIIRAS